MTAWLVALLAIGWSAWFLYEWHTKRSSTPAHREAPPGKLDLSWMDPPHDLHASEPWDKYWKAQYDNGVAGFNDIFVNDHELVRVIEARGFRTVLCVGAGLSVEPHVLAAAGLTVTMLDISRAVVAAMAQGTLNPGVAARVVGASRLRPGGSLTCIAGDLTDATICPGPYDVVIERRTLQLFPEEVRTAAVASVVARMSPNGILFTHCHNGWWRPDQGGHPMHSVEPHLEPCGLTIVRLGSDPAPTGRTAYTFLSTG